MAAMKKTKSAGRQGKAPGSAPIDIAEPITTGVDESAATGEELKKTKANIEKWGKTLMDAGWTAVPSTIIERQKKLGLDAIDMNILLHLMTHWWQADNKPHPSKGRIAEAMSLDPRTVQRRSAAMEKHGLLKREARSAVGRGSQTNRYHLDGLIRESNPLAVEVLEERATKKKRTRKMTGHRVTQ